MLNSHDVLDEQGPLRQLLDGFRPRPQQLEMAAAVERAIAETTTLIVEAGTGVGKTFAYLAPALNSGKKVLISTGTKHLQDQLYHKDLPVMRRAIGVPVVTALLKGRANYLCLHRLAQTEFEQQHSREKKVLLHELADAREWSRHTSSGDIAELSAISEDSILWPYITSTTDNCLGQECPDYQDCFVVKARRAAQEADVVVINHHLFFADLALKEEGFGELLPSANAVILDEAHQLPDIATHFFGSGVSSRQLAELAYDSVTEQVKEAPEAIELRSHADALNKAVQDMRLAMGRSEQRGAWRALKNKPQVKQALQQLQENLQLVNDALQALAERGKGLANCARRAQLLCERLDAMQQDSETTVQWYETFRRSFVLRMTPLDIGGTFQNYMQTYPCSWVFTSATLAVGEQFVHFTQRLGLADAECLQLDSPYDYANNTLCYMPQGLPEPNDSGYTKAVIEKALPVINASAGRAFLLFTSHRALREAADLLAECLPYPMLVQGTAPRRELLQQFRDAGNAVLLGTSSFWEGVDVRGEALSLVVIDKLPFASPGEPILQARLEALRAQGGNPFMDIQLPHAVITLKQGVGRLIRGENDTGVLMLCDPRLRTKAYGKVFLNSLPDMTVTNNASDVESFFRNNECTDEAVGG